MALVRSALAIAWKDARLELRSRDTIVSALVFGLIVVVIFNFGLNRAPGSLEPVAPGLLWVAYAFIGALAMNRAFSREMEQGGMDGLLAAPISRDAIFLGKVLSSVVFMLVIEAILLPIFAVMLELQIFAVMLGLPVLGLVILLATIGFATVGVFFAAMVVQTRSREILLPALFFPVIIPVVIAAVAASDLALKGESMQDVWTQWLPLLVVFDALFLVICSQIFGFIFEG